MNKPETSSPPMVDGLDRKVRTRRASCYGCKAKSAVGGGCLLNYETKYSPKKKDYIPKAECPRPTTFKDYVGMVKKSRLSSNDKAKGPKRSEGPALAES